MAKKDFRNSILEKAKKIRIEEERKREEELLSEGEKYILERKKERGEPEPSLGEKLLQERFGSLPEVKQPEPIVEEIEVEQPQPIVEQIEEDIPRVEPDWSANPFAKVQEEVSEQTEEDRISWYLEKVKDERVAVKGDILEQDLQNTPATMEQLANLRGVVTRLQTSLTSLGGGGIGYDEVRRLIQEGDYNIDSADLWALEVALENYIDSAIAGRLDSANLVGEFTTDDIEEGGNLYYTQARWDSAFSAKTTSDLPEGTNLYYTTARFDADFATKSIHDSAATQAQIDSAIGEIDTDTDLSGKTTTDLAEGSNLYYTQARFDSAFGAKSTTNLSEGSNLYYTKARHDSAFDVRLALKSTDDLTEGASNFYYTSALFDADFALKSTDSLSEGPTNLYYTDARVTALVDSAYVQERVTLEAGVHFKGVVSFANDSAPANPEAGDLYISDSDEIANATWVGIAGDLIQAQHGVVWAEADSSWHELGNTSVDTSVYVEKDGDNMTGTLNMDSGDINIKTGNLDVWNGDVLLSDAAAGVYTDNIHSRTDLAADYVTIHQGGDAKLAMKNLENVSYQAMTYPNNIAATVADIGTASTLIHKGYVDDNFILKSGDSATGKLFVPAIHITPDSDNEDRTILSFRGVDSDHELESREENVVQMNAWVRYASNPANGGWQGIAYGAGKFVATAYTGDAYAMYSTNGTDWEPCINVPESSFTSAVYGDGLWVSVARSGDDRAIYSSDGITWQLGSGAPTTSWQSVAHGNGTYVAVSEDGTNRVMYSTDGVNWNSVSVQANQWKGVAYGDGKFVSVAMSGTNRVMYSTDGINWNYATAAEQNGWQAITYGDGKFVAIANSGTNRIMYSEDGINWTAVAAPRNASWRNIAYGDGTYMASTYAGQPRIMWSTDAINWYGANTPDAAWYGLAYGDNKFVLVTYTGGNKVAVLNHDRGRPGLFYDDKLVATESNLQPLFDKVNGLSEIIGSQDSATIFEGDVIFANGELDGNNYMRREIDVKKDGNNYTLLDIKNQGYTKVTVHETGGILSGMWEFQDGQYPNGNTVTAELNMGRKKISNLGDPTTQWDAATKKYVDEKGVDVVSSEPLSTSVGSMWYDTSTGALVIRVS